MHVPFHDLTKEYRADETSISKALRDVLSSGQYVLGPTVERFEKAFASYVGTRECVGVANGLEALQITLMALGIGKGDEVITTSLSAVATALAITAVGATPIFADVDEYRHIDPEDVRRKITKRTRAIIPVHLYGQPVDVGRLTDIAQKHGLKLIEDCAQAHGARYEARKAGSFGTAGCFSFYPTKNLGTYGDGGAIVTNDRVLAERMRMLRNYGQRNRYEHEVSGINSRLDALHAAILSVKLKKLDFRNARRRRVASQYRRLLAQTPSITLPPERPGSESVYHLFVIETEHRDDLREFLAKKGIATLIHYPIPIHRQKCFANLKTQRLPLTDRVCSRILSLPCNPNLSSKEITYICNCIKGFEAKISPRGTP